MQFTRLTESEEYRRQREELRLAELELIDQVERVAALRRQLPADTVVDDYRFIDVASGAIVPLSALFTGPDRALILYHFMYGKAQAEPCPLCTMWIDGYNAAAPHITQNADFAVVAAAEPAALEAHATISWLEQPPAAQRRRLDVQVRPRQRGARRRPDRVDIGVLPRRRRHRASPLFEGRADGRRPSRARHRPPQPGVAPPGPDT